MSEPKPQYRPSIHPGRMIEHLQLPADAVIVEAKLTWDNITHGGKTAEAIDYTWSFQEAQAARRGRHRRQQAKTRARKQRPRTVQPVKRLRRPGMFAYVGRPSAAAYADNLGLRLNLSEGYQEPGPELPKPQKVFVRFYKKS